MTGKRIWGRCSDASSGAEPIGNAEMAVRRADGSNGSERLHGRIEALIARTADTLAVPAQFSARRPDYARAYLGFEAAEAAEVSSED